MTSATNRRGSSNEGATPARYQHGIGSKSLRRGFRGAATPAAVARVPAFPFLEREMHIVFSYDPPPIPMRGYDWSATLDNYEGGDTIGHGATREEAEADLIAKLAERHE